MMFLLVRAGDILIKRRSAEIHYYFTGEVVFS